MSRAAAVYIAPAEYVSPETRADWVRRVNERCGRTVVGLGEDGVSLSAVLSKAVIKPGTCVVLVDALGSTQSTSFHLVDALETHK